MKNTGRHIPCAGCEERLILSRYGELGPEEEKALMAHVSDCPACRGYMADLETTLVPLDDPAPSHAETMRAVRAVRGRIAPAGSRPAFRRLLAPAFAVMAVVVAALWIGLNQVTTEHPSGVPATVASGSGAPETPDITQARVLSNATGRAPSGSVSTHKDIEEIRDLDLLADLEMLEDMDTVERISNL